MFTFSKFDPKAHLSENVFKGMIDEFSSKFSNLKKYFSSYFGYFMARSCQIIKKYKILMIFWQNSSNTIGRFPIEIKTEIRYLIIRGSHNFMR